MQPVKRPVISNYSLVTTLYQRYASTLLMSICRQVPTREDAEDVLLEVFQAAIESDVLPQMDAGKQRAWLWSVAHNKATDHYRKTRRQPVTSVTLEEIGEMLYDDDLATPEAIALRQEIYAELRTNISTLSEVQQEVLRLRFAHGLRCNEIAQQMNKSHAAVRIMLSRALNLLRVIYKQHGEDTQYG